MDTIASKKWKKPNWSSKETEVLLEEVSVEYTLLVSQFNNSVTIKRKNAIWQRIADRVNAIGGCNRPKEACKKRWKDLKSVFMNKPKHAPVRRGSGCARGCRRYTQSLWETFSWQKNSHCFAEPLGELAS